MGKPEYFGGPPFDRSKFSTANPALRRHTPKRPGTHGFATTRAAIDITGIDIDKSPPELRAKIDTEKPTGSAVPEKIIVRQLDKTMNEGARNYSTSNL